MAVNPEVLKNDPVAFQQHREQELARREQFRTLYPNEAASIDSQIVTSLPPGVNAQEVIVTARGRNDEEEEKLAEVRKVHRRMAEVGTIPATIVNLHPWPIQATGRYLMYEDCKVPACPIGQSSERLVIRNYKIDIEDKGGRFGADVVTPIAMVNDIYAQLEPQKRGGLFRYMGDHLPGENPKTRDDEMKAWEKAKREQLKFYRIMFREAEGFFQQPARRSLNNITDNHRLVAQWMLHYRYIPVLPAWVTATREEGDIPDACPRCATDLSSGAYMCTGCSYIVDPYRAYQDNEIEEEHHAMRRLTREQLDELGLDYIQTSDEYRAEKRKARGRSLTATHDEVVSQRTGRNKVKRGVRTRAVPPTMTEEFTQRAEN